MAFTVIMAGGRGERFWPRSRMSKPKQFLNLVGDRSMLQLTVKRVESIFGVSNVYVVAGSEFEKMVARQVPHLPEENIIIEPFGRDTAAAIGLAATVLGRRDPHEVMVVLPADHYITNTTRFQETLMSAVTAARKGNEIVTLGVTPYRPETGYGYIHRGEMLDTCGGNPVYRVRRFLEKPDYERALEFVTNGDFLWNSGIFVWRIDLILGLIEEHLPRLAAGLKKIAEGLATSHYSKVLKKVYFELPKVSIDYGILEKAENVLVIPGDFGWDDIGSWTALDRYADKDDSGNILRGKGVLLDTAGTSVFSNKTVALIGVEDLIVVSDHDSLLICHKSRAQEIKKVVQALRDKGLDDVL